MALTQLGPWDPFNLESQGGYLTTYWVATQDFAGHTFTWGGDTDPQTPGAFQFPSGVAPPGGSAQRQGISHANRSPAAALRLAGSAGQPRAEAAETAPLRTVADYVL